MLFGRQDGAELTVADHAFRAAGMNIGIHGHGDQARGGSSVEADNGRDRVREQNPEPAPGRQEPGEIALASRRTRCSSSA